MSKTNDLQGGLTRRGFLKTTGAVLGASTVASFSMASLQALAAGSKSTASEGDQIFYSACVPNCENTCRLKLAVRDGKLVKVSAADFPNNAYKRICIKGLSHAYRTYDPNRIKYPMRRVGERGSGDWERISWDEAIDEVTRAWKKVQSTYGKQAIALFNGTGNMGISTLGGTPTKLINALEGTKPGGVFDYNAVTGFQRTIGYEFSVFWNQNEINTITHAKNIFIWGANLPDSQPHNWHFIQEAQESGSKIWFIDPKFSNGAAKADEYIPIRCGSDTAVLMSMMKIIFDNKWLDWDFVGGHTVAPLLVKEKDGLFLRESDLGGAGEGLIVIDSTTGQNVIVSETTSPELFGEFTIEGIKVKTALTLLEEAVAEFTPEYAEQLSTVPAERIEELARVYALDGPNTIFTLFGPDRYYNGHFFTHAMATIAGLTGNIGKLGASIGGHTLWTYLSGGKINNPGGSSSLGISCSEAVDVVKTGKYRGKDHVIKAIYACTSNFIGNYGDQNAWIEAITDPNLIESFVVADLFLTDTAKYADIVLPPAYWFEVEDVSGNGTHPYALMQEKCIEPLFESKSDTEIVNLLADKMGLGESFKQTGIEYTEQALKTNANAIKQNITLERMRKEKVVRCLPGDDDHPYIFAEGGIFPTPTKRLEFYAEKPKSLYDDPRFVPSEEHLPKFIPPIEAWPENALYKKYPLVFLQDHTRWRMHTQWFGVALLRELDPDPILYIGPEDAEVRGIKRGDMVKVFNDRGHVVLKALIHKGFPRGIVSCPKGWQRDQYIVAGSFQELTHHVSTPASDNSIFFDVLVEVERYEEGDL